MKIRINALAGDESLFSLEHRILNIVLVFGIMTCFVSSIINFFIGLSSILILATLSGGVLFTFFYYLSIIKHQYTITLYLGLFIFTFIFAPILWIYNAGTLGTIPYYIIIFSVMISTLLSGIKRFAFMFCLIITTGVLIILEYRYPFLIKGYISNLERIIDISFGLFITIISNSLFFFIILDNYNKEHKKVREYLTQLKTANEQLQREITERKQAEAQLTYLATHDYLTSISNRYSFEESLKKAVAKANRGKVSALLIIDIDNFKLVNDTKGHAAGDDLLISVANILKENLRQSDTLARLGGDEFGVLLEETTVNEARLVADKFRQITEENDFCLLKYGCFNLSLSIGVVMIDGTLNSQRLLALADTSLYTAKEQGRNRVVLLDPKEETTNKFEEINYLITQVKNAIKEDKFVLHFQPVVRVGNGKIVHHEVLIRMKGEDGELISPRTFIPVAERFGLMPQIDRWVVGASLDALQQHPGLKLFVNISGISLSEESLLEYIKEKITQGGIEPSRMGFEITETAAVKDMLLARQWIERLKILGCRFALDDFGTGFSSFSYLRMLPVDYLKIDGSFISNLDKDPSQRALVEAMSTVARSLGKRTVAEYVENGSILEILHELKIDCAQGYFLGMPTPNI